MTADAEAARPAVPLAQRVRDDPRKPSVIICSAGKADVGRVGNV